MSTLNDDKVKQIPHWSGRRSNLFIRKSVRFNAIVLSYRNSLHVEAHAFITIYYKKNKKEKAA